MQKMNRRTTVYLEPELHQALRMKAAISDRSISEWINEIIRERLSEDAEDLRAFRERQDEPVISYEELLEKLKSVDII